MRNKKAFSALATMTKILGVFAALAWSIDGLSATSNRTQARIRNQKSSSSDFSGSWKISLLGLTATDQRNQRSKSEFKIGTDLTYSLMPEIAFHARPQVESRQGSVSTVYDESSDKTSLEFKEATVELTPVSFAQLSIGAVNQQRMFSPLMMSDRSFMGAMLQLRTSDEMTVQAGLQGEAAVPSSSTKSTNVIDQVNSPRLSAVGAFLNLDFQQFDWKTRVNYFRFEDLTSSIGLNSRIGGNSTTAINGTDFILAHEFAGYEASTQISYDFVWAKYILSGAGAINQKAPTSYNQAYLIENALEIPVSSRWKITPMTQYFMIQPDAVVSAFTTPDVETNRVGYLGGLRVSLNDRFSLRLLGGEREVLFLSNDQSREKVWELKMETADVSF